MMIIVIASGFIVNEIATGWSQHWESGDLRRVISEFFENDSKVGDCSFRATACHRAVATWPPHLVFDHADFSLAFTMELVERASTIIEQLEHKFLKNCLKSATGFKIDYFVNVLLATSSLDLLRLRKSTGVISNFYLAWCLINFKSWF